ncbi:DegT/DnrJ/EryC1/StrS family aminotransferase [Marinobacter sp. R17]|nr:DegT/DnrJ/EryC1/StrS family aminotransferase [Marinobacter sp. R17]
MIPVTRPYFPPRSRLDSYLDRIYASRQLTNNGMLVRELSERLCDYLGVDYLLPVANGTVALQVAYETLGIKGAAITTPFTFPATSSSLAWQRIRPVYAGIDANDLNLDPTDVTCRLEPEVSAIVPVHTYGNPCQVEAFDQLAAQHDLYLVYDASHTFGVQYRGQSLMRWGDAATLSFHATKLFHTAEGGAIIFRQADDLERAQELINFGLVDGSPASVGVNGKMSELHAAMGLAMLEDIDEIIERRVSVIHQYRRLLANWVAMPERSADASDNGAYMPIQLKSRKSRDHVQRRLKEHSIESRAYFSPSLDSLGLYSEAVSNLAGDAAGRVLCLPVYAELSEGDVQRIAGLVCESIEEVT